MVQFAARSGRGPRTLVTVESGGRNSHGESEGSTIGSEKGVGKRAAGKKEDGGEEEVGCKKVEAQVESVL